jgi:glycosyltransferase involved in cell wall biosynthesis
VVKFSVVTVAYNAEATIARTLESVRAQRGIEIEHIVIDGASRDSTMAVVERYRDRITTLVSEPDRGVYDAMQKGLDRATGDYCGFLNADDFFAGPDALATLAALTDNGKAAGVFGAIEQIDATGKTRRLLGETPFHERQFFWGKIPPHPSVYLRTELMRRAGGFDQKLRLCSDIDMFLKVYGIADGPYGHTPQTITKMLIGGLSTSGLKSYQTVTAELFEILHRAGWRPSRLQLELRFLYKLREFALG